MLITLSCCTDFCQSIAEVHLTCLAPLGAVSYRFNLISCYAASECEAIMKYYIMIINISYLNKGILLSAVILLSLISKNTR